jgi:hypothetical protein
MANLSRIIRPLWQCVGMLCPLLFDATRFLRLGLRSPAALAAENLFLRKRLALYQEHHMKPRRATDATRFTLVWLSQWFDWHQALTVVQPETFTRWQRQGVGLFWRGTSCPGWPLIPADLQGLIRHMARDNLTWGQRRIANELRLKLGLRVSPRTVRKYMPRGCDRRPGHRVPSQRWSPFMRNQAQGLIMKEMTTGFCRGVQSLSARIMARLQRWWGRSAASGGRRATRKDALSPGLTRHTTWLHKEGSASTIAVPRVADRSPPAIGSPRVCNLIQADAPVDTYRLRPVVAALCAWNTARPNSGGIESQCQGRCQAAPWQQAA